MVDNDGCNTIAGSNLGRLTNFARSGDNFYTF